MAGKKVITKTVTTEEVHHKKPVKKKVSSKKRHYPKKVSSKKSQSSIRVEAQLIENFAGLQRVLTLLSKKYDDNTKRLSEFLDLFEESAKAFIKNSPGVLPTSPEDNWQKEITDKIDSLFEQNKVLARGLTLIHDETLNHRETNTPSVMNRSPIVAVPVRAEPTNEFPGKKESGENFRLNNKPRVKEEPDFNIQSPPFSLER